MPSDNVPLFGVVIWAGVQAVLGATEVRLTQESPCFAGQSCLLNCSVVAGQNQEGLVFSTLVGQVVSCNGKDNCKSTIRSWYNLTVVDDATSILQIRNFSSGRDQGEWTCREELVNGTNSTIYVQQNVPPAGPTFGSSCSNGRVTSPSLLKCSLVNLGVPPATVILMDSSNQTMNSSQTGSVMETVTRSGQASCSVTWSAFPSFSLNISPVLCDVQVFPSVSAVGALNVTVREGQLVTLSCDAKGYPKPGITWSPQGSFEQVDVDDTVTRGSLTLAPEKVGGVIQRAICTASNSAGTAVVSFSLSLQYRPPGPPFISGIPLNGKILKGDEVSLTCNVTGGNPAVSNVTLTCPRYSNTSQGDVSRLEFAAGSKDQGSCVCSAFHILDYNLTASLSLNVLADSCEHAGPVAITFFVTLGVSVTTTLLAYLWCRHRNNRRENENPVAEPAGGN